MRKILMGALSIAAASLCANPAVAEKFEVHLTKAQLELNCANSGGYFDPNTASGGYYCKLKHTTFDCSAAGVCTVTTTMVTTKPPKTAQSVSAGQGAATTLGNTSGAKGAGKMAQGNSSGANSTLSVSGLSTSQSAIAKNASGNNLSYTSTTALGGGVLMSRNRPYQRQQ